MCFLFKSSKSAANLQKIRLVDTNAHYFLSRNLRFLSSYIIPQPLAFLLLPSAIIPQPSAFLHHPSHYAASKSEAIILSFPSLLPFVSIIHNDSSKHFRHIYTSYSFLYPFLLHFQSFCLILQQLFKER